MNYVKSLLIGIAAAIIAVMVFLAVLLGIANWRIDAPEALLIAVVVRPDHVFLVAVIGFALGFWWSLRKQRDRVRA
jgi:hypothetical protein